MTDDVDEWAHEMRCELDKAKAEGKTQMTLRMKGPIGSLYAIVGIIQSYFRNEVQRCFVCDAMREIQSLQNLGLGHNPNWRKDARRKPR